MSTTTPILLKPPAARGHDLRADALAILAGGVALAGVCGFGLWFVSPSPPPAEPLDVAVAPPLAAAPPSEPRPAESPPAAAPTGAAANPFGALVAFAAASEPPASSLGLRRDDSAAYGSLVGLFPDAAAPPPSPIVATLEAAPPATDASPPAADASPPAADASPPAVGPAAPLPPKRGVPLADDSVPLPPPRPSQSAALEAPAPAAADQTLGPSRSLGPALAYAAPDSEAIAPTAPAKTTSIFSIFNPQPTRPPGYDDHTAVYDITGRVLYMPDGTKIEAHSGLGAYMDDPNHVDEHLKGATPPDLYDLQLRESPFHGVEAIRLIPVGGDGAVYGREGLLAHPFMMGDNGDSNGCVSIKDYDAFLKAFEQGKVTRLAVVAKI